MSEVTNFLFSIADNSTFRTLAYRENIANGKCGFLACIDKDTCMEIFSCDKGFFVEFAALAVRVTENDTGKESTAVTRIR